MRDNQRMRKLNAKWATNYDQCKTCNTTERPHFSKGQCARCYFVDYAAANPKKLKAIKRRWYRLNMPPEFQKAIREQKHFAGLRETALKRDSYACTKCGSTRQLVVHHKDRNGRPKPPEQKNNTLENLETLCRSCHLKEHRPEIYRRKTRKV